MNRSGKSLSEKLKRMLLNNWGIKIASIAIAVVLWFVVALVNNPVGSVVFNNIRVQMTGTDILDSNNKVYSIVDNTNIVRVTVRAPQTVKDSIASSDISVTADFAELREDGTIPIRAVSLVDGVEAIDLDREYVSLIVEEKATRYVSLGVNTVGKVADGYIIGNVVLDQTRIEISGPQSEVSKVASSGVVVDVTDSIQNISANMEIKLYDADGNEVNSSSIRRQTEYVRVTVEVLPIKYIPVYVSITGEPADGYIYTGELQVEPQMIPVAGKASSLANVSRVQVGDSVDITGATDSIVQSFDITKYLPENVTFAGAENNNYVTVTLPIEKTEYRNVQIAVENITVVNLPPEYSAKIEGESIGVRLMGTKAALDALDPNSIAATIDAGEYMTSAGVTTLQPKSYNMPIIPDVGDGIQAAAESYADVVISKQ
ncbi:MAG: hypothetical protein K6G57_02725 [Lachnospiraceae bacterium]|nr:hypothetical protein [Lachnospiraceae bacterium]